MQISV